MAATVKQKKNKKGKKKSLTPLQKKILKAPPVSEKSIKKIETAGKFVSKWKI